MSSRTVLTLQHLRELGAALVQGIPTDLPDEDAVYALQHRAELHRQLGELLRPEERRLKTSTENWLEKLVEAERGYHQSFFGQAFDLSPLRQKLEEYGSERIGQWLSLELEVHYMPPVTFTRDSNFPGWEVKPNEWYWQHLAAGEFQRNAEGVLVLQQAAQLPGKVVLVDRRLKPAYRDGKQMFAKDQKFLGGIIAKLRAEGKLAKYEHGPQSSRFGISADEWDNCLRSEVANLLGVGESQVRFETALEANVIPQLYPDMPRGKDGQTDTWVWYEEYFEDASRRLSGSVGCGGLAGVRWPRSDGRWRNGAVRPLGVLGGS